MHKELSLSLGIDLASVRPLASTQLYVEFLDRNAASSSVSLICASMAPCMTLYAFIGQRAVENRLCSDPSVNRWVREYSSSEFQAYTTQLEELLDRYAAEEQKTVDDLDANYRTAMELEYAFFNAFEFRTWSGVLPRSFAVDFDETLSLEDSISLMCKANPKGVDNEDKYSMLLEDYMARRKTFFDEHMPQSNTPFRREVVRDFLQKMTDFEVEMRIPVEHSGILTGLTRHWLRNIGKRIALRDYATNVLEFTLRRLPVVHVITHNWSKDMVTSALEASSFLPDRIVVHSNDLGYDDNGDSTGCIFGRLSGPVHKSDVFREISAGMAKYDDYYRPSVFVGDSLGDLSILLDVDIGILVGCRESTQGRLSTLGITLKPLEVLIVDLMEGKTMPPSASPVLYLADSWAHIGFCLFGRPYVSLWINAHRHSSKLVCEVARMPTVLSIAGSDSGGGAGIQADIKACAANGAFAATAITALTAQNTVGVSGVELTSNDMLRSQIDAVLNDFRVDAIKTGMVPNESAARIIAQAFVSHAIGALVVDPVMVTSSGSLLMPAEEAEGICRTLFPLASVVTPNIHEACSLLKIPSIRSIKEMEAAAKALFELGPAYVLLKGGHMIEDQTAGKVVDVLYDGVTFEHISGDYVPSPNTHGTGCTLASAIAANMAKGMAVPEAVLQAKSYLSRIIQRSRYMRMGEGPHGPLDHMALYTSSTLGHRRRINAINLSVYAVTDGDLNKKWGRSMVDAVSAAVAGGATVVQLREKRSSSADFLATALAVKEVTAATGVPLIINDRVDIALACGADGVHLGQDDMPVAVARKLLGAHMILGVSAKTVEQALRAERDGADYLGVGAVFGSSTKSDAVNIGIEGLARVRAVTDLPIVAIGGITNGDSVQSVIRQQVQGAAVVSAIFDSDDVEAATRILAKDIEDARLP